MKKLLLSVAGVIALGNYSHAQTSLFLEDFETGGTSFTLNTTSMAGSSGLSGDNAWVVNNTYAGGSGTSSCFGLGFTIGTTPAQPAGISNSPSSNYLHILSDDGTNNGITNANYSAADGSICFFAQSHFAEMTNDISTVGYTGVEIDFWWTCLGDVNAFGEVYYSTNGGSTWTLITAPVSSYYGSSSWSNQVIQNAAWDNQSTLRFGFRFANNVATGGGDPAFSIDDFEIFGTAVGSNSITTGTSLTPVEWCEGSSVGIAVDFTSTGTFNAGNVYTAELSDATGSFASPTSIGTLTSTSNSGTISATIPGSVIAGTGYRIRVISDNPATIGSDNTVDLVVNALPAVTQQPFSDVCEGGGAVMLVGGSPSGGSYSGSGVTGNNFDPSQTGQGSFPITYSYTDGNGCTADAMEAITVIASPTVTLDPYSNVCDDDAFFTLTGGSPSNGTYTGPGITAGVFDPASAGAGTHTITYSFIDGNGCTGTASQTITVEVCGSVGEINSLSFQLAPNPTSISFEIKSEIIPESVKLLDMNGRVVREYNETLDSYFVGDIPAGVYIVKIGTNGFFIKQRLVIQ